MITIEQQEHLINVTVIGDFSLADFKQFEEQTQYLLNSPGEINLLFDLRGMLRYTLDVAWEEIRFFNREHNHDFNKIAVVTESELLMWQAGLSRLFVDADVSVFTDYQLAREWIDQTE